MRLFVELNLELGPFALSFLAFFNYPIFIGNH